MDVREITFEPFAPDFLETVNREWQHDLGVKARMAAVTMTKAQAELVEIGRDNVEVAFSLIEFLTALKEQANALVQLADGALARMIVATHIGQDVEWRDDEDDSPEK